MQTIHLIFDFIRNNNNSINNNMSVPKVSVCVVTYNQEKYIETCLRSILDQQVNFSIEIIVSDDASTDATPDIIRKFHQQYPEIIKPMLHATNISAGVNFQVAHNAATGEYVAHCDGDDYFLPGKLQFQADFLDKNPAYVQVWHRQQLVDSDNNIVGKFPYRYLKILLGGKLSLKHLAISYGRVGQHSSQMYRRTARTIYDNFPATIDYFYALNIGAKGYSTQVNKVLGCYRTGDASTLTTTSKGKIFVEKALGDAALFYTEKYGLGKQFYGNLWVRKMQADYSKAPISAELLERFEKIKQYNTLLYKLKSLSVALIIHSSLNPFRLLKGFLKVKFKKAS